jgi:hypothetical protein
MVNYSKSEAMSSGESHLTPSESEVSDLKRSISNLRVNRGKKDGAFAFSSFKRRDEIATLFCENYQYTCTMLSDRRQEGTRRRRRGWNCCRWIISVAVASQIVLLAKSFSSGISLRCSDDDCLVSKEYFAHILTKPT